MRCAVTRPGLNLVFCSDPILTRPCKILAQSTTSCGCRHFALIRKRYRHMARLRKGLGTWPLLKSCVATWLLLSKGVGTWLILACRTYSSLLKKQSSIFFISATVVLPTLLKQNLTNYLSKPSFVNADFVGVYM